MPQKSKHHSHLKKLYVEAPRLVVEGATAGSTGAAEKTAAALVSPQESAHIRHDISRTVFITLSLLLFYLLLYFIQRAAFIQTLISKLAKFAGF